MVTLTELSALLPAAEVCDWPVSYLDCSGECAVYEKWPEPERDAVQAIFEQMAVEYLSAWTHGLFGLCDVEVRPCRQDCPGNDSWATTFWGRGPYGAPGFPRGARAFYPVLVSGQWFNVTCGCLGQCTCEPTGPSVLSLPGPVDSITEVTIDGVAVDPATYRVDRKRWLIRTDGQTWPACQDMNAAADAVGSFVVRYKRGVPAPITASVSAGRLACELAMAWCDDPNCALPDNWQTLTRQGISISRDPEGDGTYTGIWSIDQWIKSVNGVNRSFANVASPDYRMPRP